MEYFSLKDCLSKKYTLNFNEIKAKFFMQYTGIRDFYEKKIYEYDIIKVIKFTNDFVREIDDLGNIPIGENFQVCYYKDYFAIESIRGFFHLEDLISSNKEIMNCLVVGNVFENNDLSVKLMKGE